MRTAILIDGGFMKSQYRYSNRGAYPDADEVISICRDRIMQAPETKGDDLFRIYFYDCHPYMGWVTDPVTQEKTDYSQTPSARAQEYFLRELAKKEKVVIRSGELAYNGWKVPQDKVEDIISYGKSIEAEDLQYDFQQKQVDIKMGLDIALMSLKRFVDKIVLIAADSDLAPAMEHARDEGILVYLATLGVNVKMAMIAHSDGLIDVTL